MGVLLFLRIHSLLSLFSLLTLLQFPSGSTALSITCEHSGAPVYIPITANLDLKCNYKSEYPIFVTRLYGPPGRVLAQIAFTTNRAWSKVPRLAISTAANNSVILTFKNFTEAHYRSDYVLTIFDHEFQKYEEKIDLRRAEAPVISLGTDNVNIGFVDWAKVTICQNRWTPFILDAQLNPAITDVKRPTHCICYRQNFVIVNIRN